ncbi:beta-propeller domain-containing protein [Anoxynatronum buryatiense]|uniref:Secreted protein containing C-terminal beta-propeller domain n=1 Tax=Anoxynatronum buryatiense TaxID=489973 RepID=A0AA45WVT8_9CLOT|nr:beta-propeller domain-containing protein [Anoxynatronum buryatiense]SMP53779.1 Secreted protein containing C-terminal beta-propeller domain [Anoxynatronum buryatiense]
MKHLRTHMGLALALALVLLLLVPLNMSRAMENQQGNPDTPNNPGNTPTGGEETPGIETLGDFVTLKKLLDEFNKSMQVYGKREMMVNMEESMDTGAAPAEAPAASQDASRSGGAADFSTTNIQVAGVDEGDLVKTDGEYLYRINQDHIAILRVDPDHPMETAGRIPLDEHFQPQELYLDNNKLVVIGSSWVIRPQNPILYDSVTPQESGSSSSSSRTSVEVDTAPAEELLPDTGRSMIYPPDWWMPQTTTLKVYDVSQPAKVSLLREIVVEGSLLSSRKVDEALYLVTNRHFDYYWIMQERPGQAEDLLKPVYRDSALEKGALQTVSFDEIGYFPGAVEPNYITLMGLSLDRLTEPAEVEVFLGRGQNIYASRENLYVAMEKWEAPAENIWPMPRMGWEDNTRTDVYRFALNQGRISHAATGHVPGRILNQFSMDEHQGHFRIATTTGNTWRTDEGTSKNHLYVLDVNLNRKGAIEDIAPTERIYSVRFMGERAYMVTFREIDPFYVIDLKDPAKPEILGYLKIPGYSDYLHPYDANHIIGFGKEVYDVKGNAIPGGFKMAVFDVSDVTRPVEKFKLEIGDTGSDSPLLYDHKALLFSKERNLIAFPITVMEKPAGTDPNNPWQWGQFTFQGAHVYGLDLNKGFTLKAAITHLSREDYQKAGQFWYDDEKNVDRILYVGDTLLTTSNHQVQRHRQNDFSLVDQVMMREQ